MDVRGKGSRPRWLAPVSLAATVLVGAAALTVVGTGYVERITPRAVQLSPHPTRSPGVWVVSNVLRSGCFGSEPAASLCGRDLGRAWKAVPVLRNACGQRVFDANAHASLGDPPVYEPDAAGFDVGSLLVTSHVTYVADAAHARDEVAAKAMTEQACADTRAVEYEPGTATLVVEHRVAGVVTWLQTQAVGTAVVEVSVRGQGGALAGPDDLRWLADLAVRKARSVPAPTRGAR